VSFFINTNKQENFSEKNTMNNNTGSISEDESNYNNDFNTYDDNTSEEMIEMIDNYLNDVTGYDSDNEIIDEFDEDKWENEFDEIRKSKKIR
jgi:hypothetical protein